MAVTGAGMADNTGLPEARSPVVSMYHVLRRLFVLHRRLKQQEQYCKDQIPVLLAEVMRDTQYSFSPKEMQRIAKYYQLSLNVLCDNLYQLTGNQLKEEEHKRIILLSVFMPLVDDLYDDQLLNHEQIISLITAPEAYNPVNTADHVVKSLYLGLLRLTPRRQLFIEYLQAGCNWENESLKQLNENITEPDLYQITYNKSYYSLLLFYAILDHYPSQEIHQLLYPAAGLMQLTNDAFDVWKDVHNGLYTLPNLYRNFEQLQQLFLSEIASINRQLSQLNYPVKARQNYAITIHALNAMGWMSLEQLKRVTADVSTIEELKTLSRQELVCDMDALRQYMKWIKLTRRFTNHYDAASFDSIHRYQPKQEHALTS
ncbi:MAG: class 1 isoprenoid biosynthesis enzyme [Niastella sp.]|nr:class 1 isoprenoid biosynthesis enzyme [Niastella sp.]